MFLQHGSDGILHGPSARHGEDLGHFVRKVHFKQVSSVSLEEVKVLWGGGGGGGGRGEEVM